MNLPKFTGNAKTLEYNIYSEKLPESFSGFRIAHISDLHSNPSKNIGDLISYEKPDITVITGDLLQDDQKDFKQVTDLISVITKVCPVYIISGNHDTWRLNYENAFGKLTDLGAVCIKNSLVKIERCNEYIGLFGVEDPFYKTPGLLTKAVDSSFSELPDFDGYKILLFHRANLFEQIRDRGFDLILSGHMHGGQISIPYFGGVLPPLSSVLNGGKFIFPDYCSGLYKYNGTTMIVNRGASNSLPIPRFGNPTEVGIITLNSVR